MTERSNEESWTETTKFPSDRRPIHFYDVSLAAHRYVSTGGAQSRQPSTVRALSHRFTKKFTNESKKKWANRLIKIVACGSLILSNLHTIRPTLLPNYAQTVRDPSNPSMGVGRYLTRLTPISTKFDSIFF